ncbi:MAG: Dam family site-specific DNA-(adenine-N6)-methyltransferase [Clostridia bacterium]|nr:Dam family site-specific DNA-(adenine-N6)-methyltransferase [Clostridia bacterium]
MSDEKVYVPPIKIQGIKTKIVPIIKQNIIIDEDTTWVEPFMGSGVVGFNIKPNKAIFSDTNPHIINFYNQIKSGEITSYKVREFLEKEGKKLEELDEVYYYEVRNRFNENHNPLDFLFLNRSCFNGMIRFNKDYKFNVPYGHKPKRFSKAYITKIVNQVAHVEDLIKNNNWEFKCQSFEKAISEAPEKSFVYCDPPYIGRHVDYYDSWDEKSEKNLKESLQESNKKFMISTWDYNEYRKNEYIDKIWNFCNKINKEHFYFVGAKETNRMPMMEALLINYIPNENGYNLNNYNQQIKYIL